MGGRAAANANGANYAALIRNTQLAINGDAAARQQVRTWAIQTRARFDQLLAHPDVVDSIIYADGSYQPETRVQQGRILTPRLDEGWARAVTNGTYTNTAGQGVDLGIGVWQHAGNTRMRYLNNHNDHFHFRLRA